MRKLIPALILALAVPLAAIAVVTSTSSRVTPDPTGNGVTTAFTFTFPTYASSHIEVFLGGVKQVAGFTVSLNANQTSSPGGTVTFTVAPAAGVVVRIQRTLPLTQETVYAPYSAFPAKTTEKALDRSVMIAQQLQRTADVCDDNGVCSALTAPTFTGALIGNATSATSATSASSIGGCSWQDDSFNCTGTNPLSQTEVQATSSDGLNNAHLRANAGASGTVGLTLDGGASSAHLSLNSSGTALEVSGSPAVTALVSSLAISAPSFTATLSDPAQKAAVTVGPGFSSIDMNMSDWEYAFLTASVGNVFAGFSAGVAGGLRMNVGVEGAGPYIEGDTGSDLLFRSFTTIRSANFTHDNGATAAPACAASTRGMTYFTQGGTGGQDLFQVCAKDADGVYAWRAGYARITSVRDVALLANGACETWQVGLIGASVGADALSTSPAGLDPRVQVVCHVESADLVEFHACNLGTVAIDPASYTYPCRVLNP
jgi:hypothetical protein